MKHIMFIFMFVVLCSFTTAVSQIQINCSKISIGTPVVINGTGGFYIDGYKQIVWTKCEPDMYVNYTSSSDYIIINSSGETNYEVEFGNVSSNNPALVWSNQNLKSVWHMNNVSDSLATYTLTVNGAYASSVDYGKIDGAYSMPGTPGTDPATVPISFADMNLFTGSLDYTVMAIVNTSNAAVSAEVFFESGSDGIAVLRINSNAFEGQCQIGGVNKFTTSGAITSNTLYPIAWTYAAASGQELFVNGVSVSTEGTHGAFNAGGKATSMIGSDRNGNNHHGGLLDEFRIYNAVKTSTYINDTYQNYLNTEGYGNAVTLAAPPATPINITEFLLTSPSPDQNLTTDVQGNTTDTTPTFQATVNTAATICTLHSTSYDYDCTSGDNLVWTCNHGDALSLGIHEININCTDGSTSYNLTRDINIFEYTLDLSLDGLSDNLSIELGSVIDLIANITPTETVCVDINHPDYGVNYSCDTDETQFNLSIDYFRTDEDNQSRTRFNLTFSEDTLENETFYIDSHQYAEIINMSLNITGFETGNSYPDNVKIYVGDTLSNSIGGFSGTLRVFNDSTSTKNITYTTEATQTVGYIKLPKSTDVTGAVLTLTSFNNTYRQETGSNITFTGGQGSDPSYGYFYVDYEKKNRTFVAWEVKHGILDTYNVTSISDCLTNNTYWLIFRMYSYGGSIGGGAGSRPQCYDGSWNDVGTASTTSTQSYTGGTASTTYMYDSNYNTYAAYGLNGDFNTFTWRVCQSETLYGCRCARIFEESVWWNSPTRNPWLQVGVLNGTYNWNVNSLFTDSATTTDFSDRINDYLSDCTADDDGLCYVPIYLYSDIGGIIQVSDIEINYTVSVINPITISLSAIESYLESSTGFTEIPITFESSQNGTLQIEDIKFDYRGGNKTYVVSVHNTDYSSMTNYTLVYYYSDWTHQFPRNVDYIEFIPLRPTQKNVTPYGQTSFRPILNFTSQAYGGNGFNFTIALNETSSCINDTVAYYYNKSAGIQLTDSWQLFNSSLQYGETFDLYAWADYQCTNTNWYLWNPYWYLRACCVGCDICDDEVDNSVWM